MATLSPYGASPHTMFSPPDQNGMEQGGPPPYNYPHHYHQQPAPRQRTAIACRYCRRRKIRCSGFETSPDGRCSNCMRFNQECVFTPVSSQTQAFVPAPHSLHRGNSQQLYGPQGQPLPYDYNTPPYRLPSPNSYDHPNAGISQLPPLQQIPRRDSAEYGVQHPGPASPSSHLPPPNIGGYSPSPPQPGGGGYPGYFGDRREDGAGIMMPGKREGSPQSYGSRDEGSPTGGFHPPMLRPGSAGPMGGMVELGLPPGQMRRSAADGDMLQRLNSRTGF